MKTMTIRNVSAELAEALEREKVRRGVSLNRTVLALMHESLGVGSGRPRSNGLARLSGSWSEADFREFEDAVAPLGDVDEELWR